MNITNEEKNAIRTFSLFLMTKEDFVDYDSPLEEMKLLKKYISACINDHVKNTINQLVKKQGLKFLIKKIDIIFEKYYLPGIIELGEVTITTISYSQYIKTTPFLWERTVSFKNEKEKKELLEYYIPIQITGNLRELIERDCKNEINKGVK